MTAQLTLPATIYIGFADFGHIGVGNMGDFVTDMDAAADLLCADPDGRVLRIDFDVSTNLPESVSDVTEDCSLIIARRMYERGIEVAA